MISILTFFSRVLGLARDALIAFVFGTSIFSDAFFIAFRPFDTVRKLFSEGVVNLSFVPVFSTYLEDDYREKTVSFVFSSIVIISMIAVFIALLGFLTAPFTIKVFAPGFVAGSYESSLTIVLFKLMLPYLVVVSLLGLSMGILNSLNTFFAPAVAPVLFNLVIIFFTLIISPRFEAPVRILAVGVTFGGITQLFFQIPFLLKQKILKATGFRLFHPGVAAVFKKFIPSVIGTSSFHINLMVASVFATTLHVGNVSFLYYADRLVQLPLGLVAMSLSTVLLPDLSKLAIRGRLNEITRIFSNGVSLLFFFTIPAMAGLIALSQHIVTLLFRQGAFDYHAVAATADCIFYLAFGLWAFAGTRLFVTLNFSLSNEKIPFFAGVLSILINGFFCFLLIKPFGLKGLALSISLSSAISFIYLIFKCPPMIVFPLKSLIVSACRAIFVSGIMFFLVQKGAIIILQPEMTKIALAAGVVGLVMFGIIIYMGFHYVMRSPEIKLLEKWMTKD